LREVINYHAIEGIEAQLQIHVLDEPGAGGACHEYAVLQPLDIPNLFGNANFRQLCKISFQNGPVHEAGVNGITQEVLIAICVDRLRSFQAGNFPCDENAQALHHLLAALEALKSRTRDRVSRGVEGKSVQ
jgi:hypothetical protein